MERRNISSGSPWEPKIGYSRAVRVGDLVYVSGTTASDSAGRPLADDAYGQAVAVFRKIEAALQEAGAALGDVVRTRMFLTSIGDFDAAGRAHAEVFGEIRPAATMLEVGRLASPGLLVEIEVDAVVKG